MNIICKNRGKGKTHDIVKRALETGYPIVCFYPSDERIFREEAIRQGFTRNDIKVIVCDRTSGKFHFFNTNTPVLIDESELFLSNLLGVKIDTIVINKENLSSNFDDIDTIKDNIVYLYKLYSEQIKRENCDFGRTMNILKNIDMLQNRLNEM